LVKSEATKPTNSTEKKKDLTFRMLKNEFGLDLNRMTFEELKNEKVTDLLLSKLKLEGKLA
jgi:hypothetical protein